MVELQSSVECSMVCGGRGQEPPMLFVGDTRLHRGSALDVSRMGTEPGTSKRPALLISVTD